MEPPTSAAISHIRFSGDVHRQQEQGKLIALAFVFYRPETDEMEFYFPESLTEEEAIAVLREYRCYPRLPVSETSE